MQAKTKWSNIDFFVVRVKRISSNAVFSMKNILKNSEVARTYNVHKSTVSSWIKVAKKGKNNLELFSNGETDYILDIAHNHLILEKLAQEGRKLKTKNTIK